MISLGGDSCRTFLDNAILRERHIRTHPETRNLYFNFLEGF